MSVSCLPLADFQTFEGKLVNVFQANPGVTFVVAAGDRGISVDQILPAKLSGFLKSNTPGQDNVISVAATDLSDNGASFSDLDTTCPTGLALIGYPTPSPCGLDIAAPGVSVYAPTVPTGYNTSFSGTSPAAAFVAGAAALLHSIHGGTGALTGNATRKLLQTGADTIADTKVSGLRLNLNSTLGASLIDVFFLIDTTGSMGPSIQGLQQNVIDNAVAQLSDLGVNVDFGAAQFKDYPYPIDPDGSPGDFPYQRIADILTLTGPFLTPAMEQTFVNNDIGPLFASGGGDIPEAQLTALYQMATGAGGDVSNPTAPDYIAPNQQADWRTCPTAPAPATCTTLHVAVLLTDASFHCSGSGMTGYDCPDSPPYLDFQTTINALNAMQIKVIGIQPDDGNNILMLPAGSDQARALAQFNALGIGTNSLAPVAIDCLGDGTYVVQANSPIVCRATNDGTGVGQAIVNSILALVRQPPQSPAMGLLRALK
jgi:hypothetical protein